jgi:hypothetical protein
MFAPWAVCFVVGISISGKRGGSALIDWQDAKILSGRSGAAGKRSSFYWLKFLVAFFR